METHDSYAWADSMMNTCPSYAMGFRELLGAKPYGVLPSTHCAYDARLPLIRSFQKTAVDLFRASLDNDLDPVVLHWLINETLAGFGLRYHRTLEDRHFTLPVFFRTDEVRPGRIVEINCPAALFGELQLTYEHATRLGCRVDPASPADRYAGQLTRHLQAVPVVHHFLDNSTSPGSWRYFIERTRPAVTYWGMDREVRKRDCNFIRCPAFIGIFTDDEFPWRLSKMGMGVTYDPPPHVLFDQKATLVLPFWSKTRDFFSDDIRDLFPFTTPLLPTGIELPDGTRVTVEAFSSWPRKRRSYYLKYAGADWTLNLGSRAVYRLSNFGSAACLDFLQNCLREYESGRIWLLQQEETQDDDIVYLARDGTTRTERLRAKFSGFYGPEGCLGVLAMHGRYNKVHGRDDTILSYVVPG